jgi:hypothetical protein
VSEAVPEFDLYGTLGVPVSATTETIEVAFRAAAKREHPDAAADAPGSTERMQRLNVARSWLTDPTRRAMYDHVRGVDGARWSVDLPTIDPTGAWPTRRPESTVASEARSTWTVVAVSALVVNVLTIVVGIGSNVVTIAAFALSLVSLVYAGLLVILGWVHAADRS